MSGPAGTRSINMQIQHLPENHNPLINILLHCLHEDLSLFPGDQLKNMDKDQWRELADLAVEHRVVPVLYQRLTASGVAEGDNNREAFRRLKTYSRQVAKYNLQYMGELQKLLEQCNHRKIPVILLKGIYLAGQIYENPGLREMNDLDILCKKEDLHEVYRILESMGYRSINPVQMENVDNVTEQEHHLAPMIKDEVAAFEIHWNITRPDNHYSINPDKLWERAQEMSFACETAFSLSAEDLLLHLCVHTSYQHKFSFGLRPFLDLAEVIKQKNSRIDWDLFIKRARNFKWERGVYLALIIARNFTGAAVPDKVLKELYPEDEYPDILKTAVRQIFTQKKDSGILTPAMVNFANEKSLSGRVMIVIRQIFWPKKVMVKIYPVREGSLKLYLYYVVRFWEVFKRMAFNTLKIFRGDAHLTEIANRKQKLQSWLKN